MPDFTFCITVHHTPTLRQGMHTLAHIHRTGQAPRIDAGRFLNWEARPVPVAPTDGGRWFEMPDGPFTARQRHRIWAGLED